MIIAPPEIQKNICGSLVNVPGGQERLKMFLKLTYLQKYES